MLTLAPKEQRNFALAIAAGFLVCFAVLPVARDTWCSSSQQNTSAKKDSGGAQQHRDQSDSAVATGNQSAANKRSTTDSVQNERWPMTLLCSEMKLTDLALAFFTYTLAIIGLYTLRSAEQITEATERAYIFVGYSPLEFRAGRATFTLNMINAGRMPGSVTEVGWKFLTRTRLPETREQRDWQWEILEYDFIMRPTIRWDIRRFESLNGEQTFVCYIKYWDVFTKREHITNMGMHIYPDRAETQERTARAGGDEWNAWD